MPSQIGLTGGIASGKTTVAQLFLQRYGIECICADTIARDLTETQTIQQLIIDHFGKAVCQGDGSLNRRILRNKIMQNSCDRVWLESLLHPKIREQMQIQAAEKKGPYILVDIPLLSPDNYKQYSFLAGVISVQAPIAIRCKRLMQRDQQTKQQAHRLIQIQPTNAQRAQIADWIIHNDCQNEHELLQQIQSTHYDILKFLKKIKKISHDR